MKTRNKSKKGQARALKQKCKNMIAGCCVHCGMEFVAYVHGGEDVICRHCGGRT